MKRRGFLKAVLGLAGVVAVPALAKPIEEITKDDVWFPPAGTNRGKLNYKARSYMDSGFYYAPYIPLMTSNSFNPKRSIL